MNMAALSALQPVGVVGAGAMGAGIAQVAALAGHPVRLFDLRADAARQAVDSQRAQLAQLAGKPIWTPTYITISDLFRRHSDLKVADPIKSICDLHKVFVACTGIDETLDHFYGWGQLLLADFDDVDKNMVDAKADWLYNLPQWDKIFTEEKKKTLYMEQKKSGTVVKPHKVGRNDPCPCGSGKKYKHCCGR